MTIADQLTSINNSKQAIKTAIEAKGVTVGAAALDQYAGFIDDIESGGVVIPEWTRPSDWLAMPTVTSSENKVCMLVAVFDTDSNQIALSVDTIGFTIDWGDGDTESFSGGVTASHNYSYADSALDGTLTTRGYKQAIITITPTTGGQNFPVLRFQNRYAGAPTTSYSSQVLDVVISAPSCTYMSFGGANTVRHAMVERIRILSNNLNDAFSMFANCHALQKLELSGIGTAVNLTSMFSACRSLLTVPLFNTATATNMTSMFTACASLVTVPLFDTSSVTNMSSMFNGCRNLVSVPLFDTSAVTLMGSMFNTCTSLTTVPLFDTAIVTNMSSMFATCTSLSTVPLFNTGAVTTMASMFSSCTALTTVPLFNTGAVTLMGSMFTSSGVTNVPLFNTSAVTDIASMFSTVTGLSVLPAFNLSSVTGAANWTGNSSSLTRIPVTGLNATSSIQNNKLSSTALTELYTNLGRNTSARTLTVTGNIGAVTFSSAGGTTTGSKTITYANTSNFVVGMRVTGSGITTVGRSATADVTANTFTATAHGLTDGEMVSFSAIGTVTNMLNWNIYYVVNSAANTFQIAATPGGAAIDLTGSNATVTYLVDAHITAITTNTSITISVPATATATPTLVYRRDNIRIANFKNWTIN